MTRPKFENPNNLKRGTKRYAKEEKCFILNNLCNIYCVARDDCCRRDCYCFEYPKIVDHGHEATNYYECQGGYCTNYSMVGPSER